MTPQHVTVSQCKSLQRLTLVGNYFVSVPLALFLLWRLKQIADNNRTDVIVGSTLIVLRAGIGVSK